MAKLSRLSTIGLLALVTLQPIAVLANTHESSPAASTERRASSSGSSATSASRANARNAARLRLRQRTSRSRRELQRMTSAPAARRVERPAFLRRQLESATPVDDAVRDEAVARLDGNADGVMTGRLPDGTIVHNVAMGRQVAAIRGLQAKHVGLVMSPDGQTVERAFAFLPPSNSASTRAWYKRSPSRRLWETVYIGAGYAPPVETPEPAPAGSPEAARASLLRSAGSPLRTLSRMMLRNRRMARGRGMVTTAEQAFAASPEEATLTTAREAAEAEDEQPWLERVLAEERDRTVVTPYAQAAREDAELARGLPTLAENSGVNPDDLLVMKIPVTGGDERMLTILYDRNPQMNVARAFITHVTTDNFHESYERSEWWHNDGALAQYELDTDESLKSQGFAAADRRAILGWQRSFVAAAGPEREQMRRDLEVAIARTAAPREGAPARSLSARVRTALRRALQKLLRTPGPSLLSRSGIDRGHGSPHAFQKRNILDAMKTFSDANYFPQSANANRNIHAQQEALVKNWIVGDKASSSEQAKHGRGQEAYFMVVPVYNQQRWAGARNNLRQVPSAVVTYMFEVAPGKPLSEFTRVITTLVENDDRLVGPDLTITNRGVRIDPERAEDLTKLRVVSRIAADRPADELRALMTRPDRGYIPPVEEYYDDHKSDPHKDKEGGNTSSAQQAKSGTTGSGDHTAGKRASTPRTLV